MRKIIGLIALLFAATAFGQIAPFQPNGSTANIAVTATAQSLALPATPLPGGLLQIVISCVGAQTCFFRHDGVTATVANGMPVLANGQFVISVGSSATALSVIAASTGSTLYATAGLGN